MKKNDITDPQFTAQIEQLRETAPRDPHSAAAARAAFLTEARNLAQGVSPQSLKRLNNWMAAFTNLIAVPRQKRGVPMFATVVTIVLALSLAFGGGAMAASQSSMPDDTLYPLKLWSEDARISIAPDQASQFRLSLEFSARRMEEIQTMLQDGETPPEAVMTRLQNQMNNALNLAANMPDEQTLPSLLQVQSQLQQQAQMMTQLQLQQYADPMLLQTRDQVQTMLQQQLQLCQSGIEEPILLQEQIRTREQDQTQEQTQDQTQGQAQDNKQDQTQGQTQDEKQDQTQGQKQEQTQDQTQNQIQDQTQNQVQNGITAEPTIPDTGTGQPDTGKNGGKP